MNTVKPCFFEADLVRAGLTGGNLEGVRLRHLDLAGRDLSGADLSMAKANEGTTWPEGFDPVAAGVIFD